MHKIAVSFGMATVPDKPVPVRVVLDDRELQGVSSVQIALNDDGVTEVVLTLVATIPEGDAAVPIRTSRAPVE